MTIHESNQLWKAFDSRELEDGTTIIIGAFLNSRSQPVLEVKIIPKKGNPETYSYLPANGMVGEVEVFKFKVGKKKRIHFPFELESFEINTGLLKTKFKRKS